MEQLAALSSIRLRTGCFCNPGACAAALGLSPEAMAAAYEGGHVCWDDTDIIDGAKCHDLSTNSILFEFKCAVSRPAIEKSRGCKLQTISLNSMYDIRSLFKFVLLCVDGEPFLTQIKSHVEPPEVKLSAS